MEPIKHQISEYWTERSESFLLQRKKELASGKRELWLKEIKRYIPEGRRLRILDLGTGTGFFAFLLELEGHYVTGIDLTDEMISKARKTAMELGCYPDFYAMDAEEPDFEAESFDVLVTRNLSWTLPHLDKAYKEWFRLLVPGGVLINFDADYCTPVVEGQEEEEMPDDHAHRMLSPDMNAKHEAIVMELSAYHGKRPQWDTELLLGAGFDRIVIDTGVWGRVYAEKDEFYNPVPIFTLAAYKPF